MLLNLGNEKFDTNKMPEVIFIRNFFLLKKILFAEQIDLSFLILTRFAFQ